MSINIHICGLDFSNPENLNMQTKIIEEIFPQKDDSNQYYYDLRKNTYQNWNAFIYKKNDYVLIKNTILRQIEIGTQNNNEKKEYKNNMILCFADKNNDLLLCQEFTKRETQRKFAHDFPLILFIFKDIHKNNSDYRDKFFDFSYIKCINYNNLAKIGLTNKVIIDERISKIKLITLSLKSLLLNYYDNYFNENGYNSMKYLNPLSYKIKNGIHHPILLIGCPGVGKSTFINIFAGERIAKASSSLEPVTSKIAYYDVKIPENPGDFGNNELKKGKDIVFRFIDTPGFDTRKDVKITKDEIEKIFNNFERGKEHIPVILYFLKNGRCFSLNNNRNELELLEYLKKKKAKIAFIITRSTEKKWEQTYSFIEFLEEKNLQNLVEKDESNIFPCNLRGKNAFGMKEIITKLYYMLNLIKVKV